MNNIMFRQSLNFIVRNCSSQKHQGNTAVLKWDIMTAICLERQPLIAAVPNEIEDKFQKLLQEVELEKSYKSDHELRRETDMKHAEMLKKGDLDIDVAVKETAQDFEDASLLELQKFEFGSKVTNNDKSNNLKSLNRKLEKHLVLVLNQKIGSKSHYLLPQGLRQDGETLRQTAERILKHNFSEVKANIYGNAPAGFYKYKYPKKVQQENGKCGAKVFIYFARYEAGEVSQNNLEIQWLDRAELKNQLPPNYYNSVSQFLIDE